MESILTECSVSVSELKKNPTALLEEADGAAVAILNHNKPTAYLVPAKTYEALLEQIEDTQLRQMVQDRKKEKSKAVSVRLDDL